MAASAWARKGREACASADCGGGDATESEQEEREAGRLWYHVEVRKPQPWNRMGSVLIDHQTTGPGPLQGNTGHVSNIVDLHEKVFLL